MYGNPAPHFKTRPKLLEVSHEKTSQHNEGLATMSSPAASNYTLRSIAYTENTHATMASRISM